MESTVESEAAGEQEKCFFATLLETPLESPERGQAGFIIVSVTWESGESGAKFPGRLDFEGIRAFPCSRNMHGHFVSYLLVPPLCCTAETSVN